MSSEIQYSDTFHNKKNKDGVRYASTLLWRTTVSIFLAVSASLPSGAHAGVMSSIIAAFVAPISEQKIGQIYNSQNAPMLEAARNIDPNPSKGVGDVIIVDNTALLSESGPSGTIIESEWAEKRRNGHISIYVVRAEDTISSIAKIFSVSENTIRWANNIKKGGEIKVGAELVILPVSGMKYTVKTGGSLRDIIKKIGGDLDESVDYNGFGPDEHLAAGTEIVVPDAELAEKTPVKSFSGRSLPNYPGFYVRPVLGGIKTQGLHGYNAVDIGAPLDTPVIASASGTVIVARSGGWNGGYGKYVVISHSNGTQTLYGHLNLLMVYTGQVVQQGQKIGLMGSTGRSTGSHVHFEIRGARNPF